MKYSRKASLFMNRYILKFSLLSLYRLWRCIILLKNISKFSLFSGKFWAIFNLFAQIFVKMNFPGKIRLCQLLNIPIIYHRGKNQEKLITHS